MDSIVGDARNSLAASSTDVPGTGWAHLRVHVPGDKCDCFPNDVNSKVDSKASLNPPVFSDPLDDNGLVQQLEREFDARDAVIDEYAMVPPEVINGASFVRPEAGKLAISSSLAEPLFKEASLVIKSWLKDESEGAVSSYSRESQALTLAATRALLLVSGDHCTAWNVRKRMVVWSRAANKSQSPAHLLVLLEHEVHLTALVFSVRPKATSAWAHRKWTCRLAAEAFATIAAGDAAAAAAAAEGSGSTESTSKHSLNFDTSALVPPQAAAFWAREVDLCEALARKHPKNYFAWTHRLEVCRKHCTSAESLIAEAARAATFLARSPSDRAASHYNEQLLSLQLALIAVPSHAHLPPLPPSQAKTNSGESSPKGTASALTTAAVARAQGLCSTQPGHEALWQHLRVVATLRLSHAASPLCALRSSLRAATRLLPEENRLKSALAALLAEPSDDDLSVSNPEESDDDHDDDDAIGVRPSFPYLLCSSDFSFTSSCAFRSWRSFYSLRHMSCMDLRPRGLL